MFYYETVDRSHDIMLTHVMVPPFHSTFFLRVSVTDSVPQSVPPLKNIYRSDVGVYF